MSSRMMIGAGLLAFTLLCILCVLSHYPFSGTTTSSALTASLEAKLIDGKITLNGTLPDQATKDRIIEGAKQRYGVANYIDNLKIGGTTANPDWLNSALALLPFATRGGNNGGVALSGETATLSGQVATEDVRKTLVAQATTAAGNLKLNDALTLSGLPLSPLFVAKLEGGKVTLEGTVPDLAAKTSIIERATALLGVGAFIDNLKIAAPGSGLSFGSGWLNAVLNWLGLLKRFANKGEIEFNGQSVILKGEVATEEVKRRLLQDVLAALPGVNIIDQLTVIETLLSGTEAKVQAELKKQIENKIIEFDFNSDKITAAGQAVLDEVAPIISGSAEANIEISGHTDNVGSDKVNQDLSRRRAAAVRKYLAGKGIAPTRLNPNGYGASQPIADNGTEEGRAHNRRIEFRVVPGKPKQ